MLQPIVSNNIIPIHIMPSQITLLGNLDFIIFPVVALRLAQNDDAIGNITDWRKHICLSKFLVREYFMRFANFSRTPCTKSTDGREILRSTSLRWFDGFSGSVAQQVICEESISARYDGLADEDYVAVLVSMDVVHRSHDWTINERRSPTLHCPSSHAYCCHCSVSRSLHNITAWAL